MKNDVKTFKRRLPLLIKKALKSSPRKGYVCDILVFWNNYLWNKIMENDVNCNHWTFTYSQDDKNMINLFTFLWIYSSKVKTGSNEICQMHNYLRKVRKIINNG